MPSKPLQQVLRYMPTGKHRKALPSRDFLAQLGFRDYPEFFEHLRNTSPDSPWANPREVLKLSSSRGVKALALDPAVFVIDIDSPEDAAAFLKEGHRFLSLMRVEKTPRGGIHIWGLSEEVARFAKAGTSKWKTQIKLGKRTIQAEVILPYVEPVTISPTPGYVVLPQPYNKGNLLVPAPQELFSRNGWLPGRRHPATPISGASLPDLPMGAGWGNPEIFASEAEQRALYKAGRDLGHILGTPFSMARLRNLAEEVARAEKEKREVSLPYFSQSEAVHAFTFLLGSSVGDAVAFLQDIDRVLPGGWQGRLRQDKSKGQRELFRLARITTDLRTWTSLSLLKTGASKYEPVQTVLDEAFVLAAAVVSHRGKGSFAQRWNAGPDLAVLKADWGISLTRLAWVFHNVRLGHKLPGELHRRPYLATSNIAQVYNCSLASARDLLRRCRKSRLFGLVPASLWGSDTEPWQAKVQKAEKALQERSQKQVRLKSPRVLVLNEQVVADAKKTVRNYMKTHLLDRTFSEEGFVYLAAMCYAPHLVSGPHRSRRALPIAYQTLLFLLQYAQGKPPKTTPPQREIQVKPGYFLNVARKTLGVLDRILGNFTSVYILWAISKGAKPFLAASIWNQHRRFLSHHIREYIRNFFPLHNPYILLPKPQG